MFGNNTIACRNADRTFIEYFAFHLVSAYNNPANPAVRTWSSRGNTMKICPRCQKTYTDDNLNFCLDDGVVLQQAGGSNEPQPTVFMNQPPPTNPQAAVTSQPGMQPQWNTAPQQYGGGPPKRSSKAWIWVLLILGLVVVVCGGGVVGGLFYLGSIGESLANANSSSNSRSNTTTSKTPRPGTSPTAGSTPVSGEVQSIDMSDWADDPLEDATQEYTNGEYVLGTKQKRYYYVVVAKNYKTNNATTHVTVRNVDNSDTTLGYGLVVHSFPQPLIGDISFLIDSKKKRYRVVKHFPGSETALVNWTNSSAINGGTEENVLEVRDSGGKADLYINGTLVKNISTAEANSDGVPGVYSGDAVKAGFKNLEVIK